MRESRKPSLKREALAELDANGLLGVVGAEPASDTCYSCLHYVSCYITQCVLTLNGCIEVDTR